MQPSSRRFRLCILDLDGTLVDSLADIAEAVNESLHQLGLPPLPIASYRRMVGDGFTTLCRRVLADSRPELAERLAELARPRYRLRAVARTQPYPGVRAAVERLRAAGLTLAVLSNKPHEITLRVVSALWPANTFARVVGCERDELRKPNPANLLDIAHELGCPLDETCLVGDTATDIETARRAGVSMVSVTWGFRDRAELEAAGASRLIDHADELASALGC